jgi:hypothetical protein
LPIFLKLQIFRQIRQGSLPEQATRFFRMVSFKLKLRRSNASLGQFYQAWRDYFTCTVDNHFLNIQSLIMGNLLYIIAVILIIGWLLGMFAFNVSGGLIHALLVIAIILFLVKLLGGRRGI